jgi:hypothetical protein
MAQILVGVNELHEIICDVAFEGKVPTYYGIFDKIPNQVLEHNSYHYLHCNVLNKEDYTTITVCVMSLLVDEYEIKFKVSCYIPTENFGIMPKSLKNLEKGNMFFIITVMSTTTFFL